MGFVSQYGDEVYHISAPGGLVVGVPVATLARLHAERMSGAKDLEDIEAFMDSETLRFASAGDFNLIDWAREHLTWEDVVSGAIIISWHNCEYFERVWKTGEVLISHNW